MNQEKIGMFIARCRKEKGLTQSVLGEKLGVSYKAVSKWGKRQKYARYFHYERFM